MNELIVFMAAFIVGGFIQGFIGFGFAVATTLLLVNTVDFPQLVFLNIAMSIVTSIFAMFSAKNLKAINRKALLIISSSALIGLIPGIIIIKSVDIITLKKLTLLVILIASLLSLYNKVSQKFFAHRLMAWWGGYFSGVLTPATGINGPLVVLYLNAAFKDKVLIRTTMLAYLLIIMSFGLLLMGIQTDISARAWAMIPQVTIPSVSGYVIGLLSFKKVSAKLFQISITAFLIVSSLISLLYLII